MKIVQKIPIAKQSIRSIARHDDAEAAYVETALDQLAAFIEAERQEMRKRREAKWRAELASQDPAAPSPKALTE